MAVMNEGLAEDKPKWSVKNSQFPEARRLAKSQHSSLVRLLGLIFEKKIPENPRKFQHGSDDGLQFTQPPAQSQNGHRNFENRTY